ncbi:MAG: hypothetical protein IJD80_01290, partial [Oscillospiraceae bacterium]|nr:hypothetical protein [Oscillospiraceae bacterium]
RSDYLRKEFFLFKTESEYAPFSAAAAVKYKGEGEKWLTFDGDGLLKNFGMAGLEQMDWNDDYSKFTLKCSETDTVLTVDFVNGNAFSTASEAMVENKLNFKLADTKDGSCSLWQGETRGGGDVGYQKIYLVENSTGKVKFIDEIGGMYGGGEEAGFFSNNDVYVISYDDFKIFDTDMNNSNAVYQLGNWYPLGKITVDGVPYYRYLVAARRDPSTKDILFVYFDLKYTENYEEQFLDYSKNDRQLKGTYKVAVIDKNGKLGYLYDTGVYAMTDAFGISPVSISLDDNTTLHISCWRKHRDNIFFEGTVDLTTGQFTFIKDLSWLNTAG